MEEKEKQVPISRREVLDESHISINNEIKNANEIKIEVQPNKLEIIEEETKNYVDEMKKGTYNILVAVRCRPLSQKEKEFSEYEIVRVMDRKMVLLMDPFEYNGPNEIFKNRSREQSYAFDLAFEKTCNQQVVFTHTTKFLIEGVVNGYNATVFAYGATGAGKTYTMLGNEEEPGIMPLTLTELFDKIQEYSFDREYKVKLWYLEIYNENIRDLLSNTEEYLDLREDPAKGVTVTGILELNVTSCKDILSILRKGNKNRTQESTNANETSSRSHAILQVLVEYKEKASGIETDIKFGKLSLIDLAGSERASATQNRGIRLIEGANINRSLLTLGNCINALCEANEKGTKNYVPYRDSKLTRLLKDSLGGNSRTVMIANVSPAVISFEDTYNTLKYANRAKNIKTHVQRNVLNVQYHISNYVNIINNLKNEIYELKSQLGKREVSPTQYLSAKVIETLQKKEERADTKEKDKSSIINKFNQTFYEKAVQDVKMLCEEELLLKQKVIDQQMEINNLKSLIHRSEMDTETTTNEKGDPENTYTENNNTLNVTPNMVMLENIEQRPEQSKKKEQKEKLKSLRMQWEKNIEKLREYPKKKEQMMNVYYKSGVKDFYYDYLQEILKSHSWKILLIDNKFKANLHHAQLDYNEAYIQELENQLKFRDEILTNQGVKLYDEEFNSSLKYKSVEQLRNEYAKRIPFIPISREKDRHDQSNSYSQNNNNIITINQSSLPGSGSNINLPPINNLSNLNAILADVKNMNQNLNNKLEAFSKGGGGVGGGKILKNMFKFQENNNNINNFKEVAREKFNQVRNYSQGVRNMNIPTSSSNVHSNNSNGNGNVNTANTPITLNQKIQMNKYPNLKTKDLSGKDITQIVTPNYNPLGNLNPTPKKTHSPSQGTMVPSPGSFPLPSPHIITQPNTTNMPVIKHYVKKKSGSSRVVAGEEGRNNNQYLTQNYSNTLSHSSHSEDSSIIEIDNSADECNDEGKSNEKRSNHFKEKKTLDKSIDSSNSLGTSPKQPQKIGDPINVKRERDESFPKNNFAGDIHPIAKKKDLNVFLNEKNIKKKKIPFKF